MTLVLAVAANDGVAIVADGKAMAGKRLITRTPAHKLGDLHGKVAYGCAGSAGLRQRVVESLEKEISEADCEAEIPVLRPKLLAAVNRVQHEANGEFVRPLPFAEPDGIEVLFAGVSGTGVPWIYEVTEKGGDEVHFKAEAIGSGRPYASYALMSAEHYKLRERGLAQARVLAYRAVNDAIRTDATELGLPINLYLVTGEGAREVSGAELKALELEMVAWQGHEREVFERLGDDDGSSRPRSHGGPETGIEPPAEKSS